MYGWETRMLLRHYLEQGISKADLSRRFGVSRRTIHRWVESGQLDVDLSSGAARYSPRPRPPHKLDPYKELIEVRLGELPVLFEGLESAFGRFGGVPRELLFDQMRAVVVSGRPRLGRRVGAQRRVSAVRGPLGLRAAVVPSLPGADQGQGGAPDPVRCLRHGRIPLMKSLVSQAGDLRGELEDLCDQLTDARTELRRIAMGLWVLLILMMYATAGVLGIAFHLNLN